MSNYTNTTIRLLTDYDGDMSWQQQAECRRTKADGSALYDSELFFPTGTAGPAAAQAEEAKAVCHRCPSEESCKEWALATLEYGVAGGLDEEQRRVERRERARAARNEVAAS